MLIHVRKYFLTYQRNKDILLKPVFKIRVSYDRALSYHAYAVLIMIYLNLFLISFLFHLTIANLYHVGSIYLLNAVPLLKIFIKNY